MNWEIVIGLETHVQLSTVSKIFSGAATRFGAAPNMQACAVDLALPGTLPVMNRGAVERAICFGLAIGAKIAPYSVFERKHYFYPDLPKGYQVSQHQIPIVRDGKIILQMPANEKTGQLAYEKVIRIPRAHLEEDAGKSLHEDFSGKTGIDLNRAGTPLLEIVTEPDLRGAAEALAYAKVLHGLVVWLGICDGNMQEGSFRCDANVSVRPVGQLEFGTRSEIKNLNSFRFMEEAIHYEVQRQINLIEEGRAVQQETRLYDPEQGETRAMRSKEEVHDYRYFSDPDLMPLIVDAKWIDQIRMSLPELPVAMQTRFVMQYGLELAEAQQLTTSKAYATYYESVLTTLHALGVARTQTTAKLVLNWVMGELTSQLKREGMGIESAPVYAGQLAHLLARIVDGTLSNKIARELFLIMWVEKPQDIQVADHLIESRGLQQISDSGALDVIINEVLAANEKLVEKVRSGKEKAFNALMGKTMEATKGLANPQQVNEQLKSRLS